MVRLVVMQIVVLVLASVVSTTKGDISSTLTIVDLYNSLQQTNRQLESLQQKVIVIENENYQKNNEIVNLKHGLSAKNNVIEQLNRRVSMLEDALAISRERNAYDSTFSTNLTANTKTEVLDGQTHTRQGRKAIKVKSIKTSRNRLTRVSPVSSTVAFNAQMSTDLALHEGTTIVFDQELLDTSNMYTPLEGIFTVPVSGVYVITWTMFSRPHTEFATYLIVNGEKKGATYTDSDEVNDFHTSTGIVPLILNKGDPVYIKMGSIDGTIYSYYNAHTAFSGWLLDPCCV